MTNNNNNNNNKNSKNNNKPKKTNNRPEFNWRNQFPNKNNANKTKLTVSNRGKHTFTFKEDSKKDLDFILSMFPSTKKDIVITDGTGNMGGNTIQFALSDRVSKVLSVEIDEEHFQHLKNNISVYGLESKVELVKGDYCKLARTIKQDVVFLDPPKEHSKHKKNRMAMAMLGKECSVSDVIKELVEKKVASFIVVKVNSSFPITRLMLDARLDNLLIHKVQKDPESKRAKYLLGIRV